MNTEDSSAVKGGVPPASLALEVSPPLRSPERPFLDMGLLRQQTDDAESDVDDRLKTMGETLKAMVEKFKVQKNINQTVKIGVISLQEDLSYILACRGVAAKARAQEREAANKALTPPSASQRSRRARKRPRRGSIEAEGSPKQPDPNSRRLSPHRTEPEVSMNGGESSRRDKPEPPVPKQTSANTEAPFRKVESKRERRNRKREERRELRPEPSHRKHHPKQPASTKPAVGRKPPQRKPDAVLIKPAQGRSFSEVLAGIRKDVKPETAGAVIRSVRKTRSGDVLVELGSGTTDKAAFENAIRAAVGESATVRQLEHRIAVEIRDLDSCTTAEEVIDAVNVSLGSLAEGAKVSLTAENSRGLRMAVVDLGSRGATQLLKAGKLRVGWVIGRVRLRVTVTRCFRCFGYGHQQSACKGPDRRGSGICIKCGEPGHVKSTCTAKAKCFLCEAKKYAPLEHIPGTRACRVFREALDDPRRRH